LQNLVLLG